MGSKITCPRQTTLLEITDPVTMCPLRSPDHMLTYTLTTSVSSSSTRKEETAVVKVLALFHFQNQN